METNYVCSPIVSLNQLLNFANSSLHDASLSEALELVPDLKPSTPCNGRKVLLCHDMKGGYLEDRFLDDALTIELYSFTYWSKIDAFIYFSHDFVTVPTLPWISAAHKNHTPVLGTFITENQAGEQHCVDIFQSIEMVDKVVDCLVSLAKLFKFEGWLINIENSMSGSHVKLIVRFLERLTNQIHEQIIAGQVIWYDSVTDNGVLAWQNELNSKNKCFFDACDGIFLNYSWNEVNLTNSLQMSETVSRRYNVYVGIDVFGRNFFGGGGFNTSLAVEKINEYDLSLAIFAPGWVHEVLGAKDFLYNQSKFWSSLRLSNRRFLTLPIETSFCPGFGYRRYFAGRPVSDQNWWNLLKQELQPFYCTEIAHCYHDAFDGSAAIIVHAKQTIFDISSSLDSLDSVLVYIASKGVSNETKLSAYILGKHRGDSLDTITEYLTKISDVKNMPTSDNLPFGRLENGWQGDWFKYDGTESKLTCVSGFGVDVGDNNQVMIGKIKITKKLSPSTVQRD